MRGILRRHVTAGPQQERFVHTLAGAVAAVPESFKERVQSFRSAAIFRVLFTAPAVVNSLLRSCA